jgi:hypothetical protein
VSSLNFMAEIIREIVRSRKREWIRQCPSMSLGFDDRQGAKLRRTTCDAAESSDCCTTAQPHRKRRCSSYCSLLADGYACHIGGGLWRANLRGVLQALRGFRATLRCLRRGSLQEDLGLEAGLCCRRGRGTTCRCLKMRACPKVPLVLRDPAHVLRAATTDPLRRTVLFAEQHALLFTE